MAALWSFPKMICQYFAESYFLPLEIVSTSMVKTGLFAKQFSSNLQWYRHPPSTTIAAVPYSNPKSRLKWNRFEKLSDPLWKAFFFGSIALRQLYLKYALLFWLVFFNIHVHKGFFRITVRLLQYYRYPKRNPNQYSRTVQSSAKKMESIIYSRIF